MAREAAARGDSGDIYTDVVERMEKSLETAGITVPGARGEQDWRWTARGLERALDGDYGNAVTHRGELVDEGGEATDALFYVCREDEVATEIIARNLRDAAMRGTRGTVCAVLVFFSSEGLQAGATSVGRIKEIRTIANLDHIKEICKSPFGENMAFVPCGNISEYDRLVWIMQLRRFGKIWR